ncbi:unnamed protein product [Linum trigynum]|uniref:Uncharacterized protein n=1 Tax=Linum trigynum TaxID=586398 RepID=A0AAV2G1H3_9ROSI
MNTTNYEIFLDILNIGFSSTCWFLEQNGVEAPVSLWQGSECSGAIGELLDDRSIQPHKLKAEQQTMQGKSVVNLDLTLELLPKKRREDPVHGEVRLTTKGFKPPFDSNVTVAPPPANEEED